MRTPAELVSERLLEMSSAEQLAEQYPEPLPEPYPEPYPGHSRVTELLAWLVEYHRRE